MSDPFFTKSSSTHFPISLHADSMDSPLSTAATATAALRMHGFLTKRGARVKTWKKRFFSFDDGVLAYRKSDRPDAKLLREDFVANVFYWSGRRHGLCVQLRSGRALYIKARSEPEVGAWFSVLDAYLQRQQLAIEFRRLLTRRQLATIKESLREDDPLDL